MEGVCFSDTLHDVVYCSLQVLLPTLEEMRGDHPHVIVQDNAPQHTATITKNWFQDHEGQVSSCVVECVVCACVSLSLSLSLSLSPSLSLSRSPTPSNVLLA